MSGSVKPIGAITRGTTHPNRLRRVDRWIAAVIGPGLRRQDAPLAVDLGFGASPVTTIELQQRLPGVTVVGLEIDPQRVAAAKAAHPLGTFDVGGFELGPYGGRASLVRAFNVLRQYDEQDVAGAWARMAAACRPGGVVVEGTCDELGRLASWVRIDTGLSWDTPVSLTLSMRLSGLQRPGGVSARLPKALIHHNIPGERVHAFLDALDTAWMAAAPMQSFGVRQRWVATVQSLREQGCRVLDREARWRLGEVTVAWAEVAP